MAKKTAPIITELCPHCRNEVEIKGTMNWHKCPICGNYIKPCSLCNHDTQKCDNCPLFRKEKPMDKIGNHAIDEIVLYEDYLDMVFDWEEDTESTDGESYKIHVNLTSDGTYHVYEDRYDLNMHFIDCFECREHISDHDVRIAANRLRKVARKIS